MTFIKSFLRSLHSSIEYLTLGALNIPKNAVRAICNAPAFKGLEYFFITEPAYPTGAFWIEALMEAKCTSLKELYIRYASLAPLQIDEDLFFNFVKSQSEGFQITIRICEGMNLDRTVELRNELLDKHFECVKLCPRKRGVIICYGDLKWYYVLRVD
uniref:F-box domain-containing protein n=1 Tax=Panagrellus redivivus TaxID=6233 RepID=A0A7E4WBU7_PANRE